MSNTFYIKLFFIIKKNQYVLNISILNGFIIISFFSYPDKHLAFIILNILLCDIFSYKLLLRVMITQVPIVYFYNNLPFLFTFTFI